MSAQSGRCFERHRTLSLTAHAARYPFPPGEPRVEMPLSSRRGPHLGCAWSCRARPPHRDRLCWTRAFRSRVRASAAAQRMPRPRSLPSRRERPRSCGGEGHRRIESMAPRLPFGPPDRRQHPPSPVGTLAQKRSPRGAQARPFQMSIAASFVSKSCYRARSAFDSGRNGGRERRTSYSSGVPQKRIRSEATRT